MLRIHARSRKILNLSQKNLKFLTPLLFLSPALLGLILFRIIPITVALFGSLYSFKLIGKARHFVGLGNFERLFEDPLFWHSLINTVVFVLGVTSVQVCISLGLALLLTRNIRGVVFFRTLIFVPVVLSMVVASATWKIAFDSNAGLFNSVLGAIGDMIDGR